MVAQDFITSTLSRNLTIAELANLADALDTRAGECFEIARIAHERHNNAVCIRFNAIALDAADTADALRAIVYQSAQYPFAPSELDAVAVA